MMELTETIVSQCAQKVLGTMKIQYEGVDIDLTPPWPRLTMLEAVAKYSGKDFTNVTDLEVARKMAKEAGIEFEPAWGVGKIINAFFNITFIINI